MVSRRSTEVRQRFSRNRRPLRSRSRGHTWLLTTAYCLLLIQNFQMTVNYAKIINGIASVWIMPCMRSLVCRYIVCICIRAFPAEQWAFSLTGAIGAVSGEYALEAAAMAPTPTLHTAGSLPASSPSWTDSSSARFCAEPLMHSVWWCTWTSLSVNRSERTGRTPGVHTQHLQDSPSTDTRQKSRALHSSRPNLNF